MILGGAGTDGGRELPRIVQVSLTRPARALPARGRDLDFQVSVHEEGAPLTWVTDVSVPAKDEESLVAGTAELARWAQHRHLEPAEATALATKMAERLHRLVLGRGVAEALDDLRPSAVHLGVDETVLHLPWELLGLSASELPLRVPFGRVVSSRVRPSPRRDALVEDRNVRILAIENPTEDLDATSAEVAAITALSGPRGRATIEVEVLREADATLAGVAAAVADGRFDMVHFAGHGRFDDRHPGSSELLLAGGDVLTADGVARLPWTAPPYVVCNSACESARGGARSRLVSRNRRTAGLPAAFLAAGVQGYLGHFFPVDSAAAAVVAGTFYAALFELENVGAAVREARRAVRSRFDEVVDLTCFGLTYFGDAGGAERADLATAV